MGYAFVSMEERDDALPGAVRSRARVERFVLLLLFYLEVCAWLSWPLITHLSSRLPAFTKLTFRFDPMYVIWALSWETHTLLTAPWSLLDANIFHPTTSALLYGPTVFGALPYFAPTFALTGNPVLAINLMYLMGVTATALAVHLVTVAWTGAEVTGFVAATAFLVHAWLWNWVPSSPHYVVLFYLPVILYLAAGPMPTRRCLLLAPLVTLQALVDPIYIASALFATLAVLAGARLLRGETRSSGARLFAVLLVSVLPLVPIYAGYARVRAANPSLLDQTYWGATQDIQFRWPVTASVYGIYGYGPADVSSFVLGTVLLGAVALLIARPTPGVRTGWVNAAVWSAVGLILSTRVLVLFGHDPFELPYFRFVTAHFPTVIAVLRIQARLGVGALIGIPILAGLSVDAWGRATEALGWPSAARAVRLLLATVLGAILLREIRFEVPQFPLWEGPEVNAVALRGLRNGSGPMLELPLDPDKMDIKGPIHSSHAMYRSIFHWRPLLNGYSSFYPVTFLPRMALARRLPDPDALATLVRETGLSAILVHIHELPEAERARWRDARLTRSDLRVTAADWMHLLFEVRPPASADSAATR
jgi:hypothetical protein